MANRRTVKLASQQAREWAKRLIDDAPDGFVASIGEETRTQAQNRLMWPVIQDLQKQVEVYAAYSAEDMKLRFLNALGTEMRFLPEIEGPGMFPVGQKSSTLSKPQFSALLELMFADGARKNVMWSTKSKQTAAEYGVRWTDPQDRAA